MGRSWSENEYSKLDRMGDEGLDDRGTIVMAGLFRFFLSVAIISAVMDA